MPIALPVFGTAIAAFSVLAHGADSQSPGPVGELDADDRFVRHAHGLSIEFWPSMLARIPV
jgi:hypothetical protein